MSAENAGDNSAKPHVFADQDAELIYRGLLQIVSAVEDLKEVIVDLRNSIEIVPGRDGA